MRRRQSLEQQMREDAGLGIDKRDSFWWLDDEIDIELIEALEAFDQLHNLQPLKDLFCRGRSPSARRFVDDFFDRHPPTKKRGRQRTPAYDRVPMPCGLCWELWSRSITFALKAFHSKMPSIGWHRVGRAKRKRYVTLSKDGMPQFAVLGADPFFDSTRPIFADYRSD
jgi:hypothetical protein